MMHTPHTSTLNGQRRTLENAYNMCESKSQGSAKHNSNSFVILLSNKSITERLRQWSEPMLNPLSTINLLFNAIMRRTKLGNNSAVLSFVMLFDCCLYPLLPHRSVSLPPLHLGHRLLTSSRLPLQVSASSALYHYLLSK